jgi:hypothetical protein
MLAMIKPLRVNLILQMIVAVSGGVRIAICLDRYVVGWEKRLSGTHNSERQGQWNCH